MEMDRDKSFENIDPELQLLKYKKKCTVILEILKSRSQKEEVEDFVSTIESAIPIINRILTVVSKVEKKDVLEILVKLNNSLEEYENVVVKLEKTGKLKRFLTNNRLRKKLEKINSSFHKDFEFFVDIAVQFEVTISEKEQKEEEERKKRTLLQHPRSNTSGVLPLFQVSSRDVINSQSPRSNLTNSGNNLLNISGNNSFNVSMPNLNSSGRIQNNNQATNESDIRFFGNI